MLASPFVGQYARPLDLAMRAKQWRQLFDPVLPNIILAWARRVDIAVPSELTAAAEKIWRPSQGLEKNYLRTWNSFTSDRRVLGRNNTLT